MVGRQEGWISPEMPGKVRAERKAQQCTCVCGASVWQRQCAVQSTQKVFFLLHPVPTGRQVNLSKVLWGEGNLLGVRVCGPSPSQAKCLENKTFILGRERGRGGGGGGSQNATHATHTRLGGRPPQCSSMQQKAE